MEFWARGIGKWFSSEQFAGGGGGGNFLFLWGEFKLRWFRRGGIIPVDWLVPVVNSLMMQFHWQLMWPEILHGKEVHTHEAILHYIFGMLKKTEKP